MKYLFKINNNFESCNRCGRSDRCCVCV